MKAKLLGSAVAVGLVLATAGSASAQVTYSTGYVGYPGTYYSPSAGAYFDYYPNIYSHGYVRPAADVSSYNAFGYNPYYGWATNGYNLYRPNPTYPPPGGAPPPGALPDVPDPWGAGAVGRRWRMSH